MKVLELARENLRRATKDSADARLPESGWRWQSYCIHARERMNRF